jgi:hypothetical protein
MKALKSFVAAGVTILIISFVTGTKIDLRTVLMTEIVCGVVHYVIDEINE